MLIIHRTALRRRMTTPLSLSLFTPWQTSPYHTSIPLQNKPDPRISSLDPAPASPNDHIIKDDFALIRENYQTPRNPIILAHGLLGFDELRVAPNLPGIQYWRGITSALAAKGVEVVTAAVPAAGSIEARAEKLAETIAARAGGKSVNIIAGLDSRYMISRLHPPNVDVVSLTTIATPHRGSAFADEVFNWIGIANVPKLYKVLNFFGLEAGAFSQLTRKYMAESFNPRTPDVDGIRYYSYGARMQPHLLSMFRQSHHIVERDEGPNDGLVSVTSSRWGNYKGTLDDVSHLDLINWTNRLRWMIWELTGNKRNFNAIALYLDIADMLAKEGL